MPLADSSRIQDPQRLDALRATGLLDSDAEECFDRFTRLASRLVGTPVGLLSLVDAHRQFLKSRHGTDLAETPLSHSFCQHVVAGDRPLVVEDARTHPLVRDNQAIEDFGVIAYAGVPVRARGETLGALCVVETRPTRFTQEQVSLLEDLAAACAAEIELRLALRDARRANERLHQQAYRDALTGLRNRRALIEDLGRAVHDGRPASLALLDLDGFKAYNDRFGHLAGDDLLRRMAGRLAEGVDQRVYRMGGDEFCLLTHRCGPEAHDAIASARAALAEAGDGYSITASAGVVRLPDEAMTSIELLRLADTRMYAEKRGNRGSARRQATDALLRVLAERDDAAGTHVGGVAKLAAAVARRLGMTESETIDVRDAAQLHDIGMLAVPEAILAKPAPLADDELAMIRRHTEIGERIVAAAPSLEAVGAIVRATHERWDGRGWRDPVGSVRCL